ncbi:hypothetical protein [Paraburkholderia caledonica]|uniref:hypothetical protein n=1 Tax=Paraburkholderia caledonica TaxID=134536 RepID=UPI0015C5E4C8|nr:hypothetical protein [Paraburkholderia caledonica]
MATMEVAAMPVCLLRTLPIRFLRLFNTNASDLAYREEGLSFPARLTRAAQEPWPTAALLRAACKFFSNRHALHGKTRTLEVCR